MKKSEANYMMNHLMRSFRRRKKNIMVRLQKLINWEENVLRQKSKCQWIQAGDKLEFKILF